MIVVCNTNESTTTLSNIDGDCVQQAAVDLRLEKVWRMEGLFKIDEESKHHRTTVEVNPDPLGGYYLEPGCYEISYDHNISIGADEAAYIVTRSTLARNGCFIAGGLWDPSFIGRGGNCLHVNGGPIYIKKGTRVGQFVIWKVANAQGAYQGDYGLNADGTPKEMETKYHG